ncbi:HAD family phosphatase [Candidatus Parcubacteria bacterium]|nr:HAD family phosphatase [Candidatus Parcubacteria bacterium]
MRRFEAVIFDMDGLMVDSEHLHSRSFEIVLNNHGVKPELNESGIIQTLGVGTPKNWEKLKEKYNLKDSVEKLTRQKHDAYVKLIPEISDMPGLKPLLKDLKKSKIKLAVASGSSKHNIDEILNLLNIKSYFDAVVSGEELDNAKPAPDIFLEATKHLNVTPANCIILEDAQSGIKAGKAAGATVVAVPNRFSKNQDLFEADHIFNSLEDLSAEKLKKLLA